MSLRNNWRVASLALVLLMLTSFGLALADSDGPTRAAWLLQRGNFETRALTGLSFDQGEFGGTGGGGGFEMESEDEYVGGISAGLTMLASAILPGSGEAIMGYKRGYLMMAVDIFAWTQVSKYHKDGEDLADAYYAYADEHYSDERLVLGYNPTSSDLERQGEGPHYFNFPNIESIVDVESLGYLPLYVTVEADRREYYENLGKWDQFIFGWDDYTRASVDHDEHDYVPTHTISDLRQPWVSRNRGTYRDMRAASNDAYKSRDRWMYVNIGMRVFSVLQVAYLQGLLGGGEANYLEVAGHPVEIIAQPYGLTRGSLAAKVSF